MNRAATKTAATVTATGPCFKCCGAGKFRAFKHVEAGVCFACNGTGRQEWREIVKPFVDDGLLYTGHNGTAFCLTLARDPRATQLGHIASLVKSGDVNTMIDACARLAILGCPVAIAKARAYYPAADFDACLAAFERAVSNARRAA